MPPIENIARQKGSKRLRFLRNTAYQGTDYGPDYPQAECDVELRHAYGFIASGRAVEVAAREVAPAEQGRIQTRDPRPQHRDPTAAASAPATNLRKLNKAPLLALARARGIGATEFQTRREIIETIEAAELEK